MEKTLPHEIYREAGKLYPQLGLRQTERYDDFVFDYALKHLHILSGHTSLHLSSHILIKFVSMRLNEL